MHQPTNLCILYSYTLYLLFCVSNNLSVISQTNAKVKIVKSLAYSSAALRKITTSDSLSFIANRSTGFVFYTLVCLHLFVQCLVTVPIYIRNHMSHVCLNAYTCCEFSKKKNCEISVVLVITCHEVDNDPSEHYWRSPMCLFLHSSARPVPQYKYLSRPIDINRFSCNFLWASYYWIPPDLGKVNFL
jgi:hypothetical protein